MTVEFSEPTISGIRCINSLNLSRLVLGGRVNGLLSASGRLPSGALYAPGAVPTPIPSSPASSFCFISKIVWFEMCCLLRRGRQDNDVISFYSVNLWLRRGGDNQLPVATMSTRMFVFDNEGSTIDRLWPRSS
jgi:hypothetical protein